MKLETKLHYKVRFPMIGACKPSPDGYQGSLLHLGARVSEMQTVEHSGVADMLDCFPGEADFVKWVEANRHSIELVNRKANQIRQLGDEFICADAVFYTLGLAGEAVKANRGHLPYIYALASCCIDMPPDRFDEVNNLFDEECRNLFKGYLPNTLAIWPRIRNSEKYTQAEKDDFDEKALAFFDYVVARASLAIHAADGEYGRFVRRQLLYYYKWLVIHAIYPPLELQHHLQMLLD